MVVYSSIVQKTFPGGWRDNRGQVRGSADSNAEKWRGVGSDALCSMARDAEINQTDRQDEPQGFSLRSLGRIGRYFGSV